MNILKFSQFLEKNLKAKTIPPEYSYPDSITLDTTIWKNISNLKKFTDQYNYEHSLSLYFVDNELITTPPIKGTKSFVISKESLKLEYSKIGTSKFPYFEKRIYLNGKVLFKKKLEQNQIPKDHRLNILFNIHTHPIQTDSNYSFFSIEDISNFLSSQEICIGLLTDEMFLLCRTNRTQKKLTSKSEEIITDMNRQYIQEKNLPLEKLHELDFILYIAQINNPLKRIV